MHRQMLRLHLAHSATNRVLAKPREAVRFFPSAYESRGRLPPRRREITDASPLLPVRPPGSRTWPVPGEDQVDHRRPSFAIDLSRPTS